MKKITMALIAACTAAVTAGAVMLRADQKRQAQATEKWLGRTINLETEKVVQVTTIGRNEVMLHTECGMVVIFPITKE
jgi:uncharacterized membrane protein